MRVRCNSLVLEVIFRTLLFTLTGCVHTENERNQNYKIPQCCVPTLHDVFESTADRSSNGKH